MYENCSLMESHQTAAELERRRENFSKELDFVIADVVCILVK